MLKIKKQVSSKILSDMAVKGMQEIKAKEIKRLNLSGIQMAVSDYFVICHGDSDTHVSAIAGSVEKTIEKELNQKPFHREGSENNEWILLDYFDVVVHIFKKEKREFYGVEELWADAPSENID